MNKEYCFKLKNLVNNLNGNNYVSNIVDDIKHSNKIYDYVNNAKEFYTKHNDMYIQLAEANINTIADYYDYIDWIGYD